MQTGLLGLWGKKVDAIEYYTSKIEKLSEEVRQTCHFAMIADKISANMVVSSTFFDII